MLRPCRCGIENWVRPAATSEICSVSPLTGPALDPGVPGPTWVAILPVALMNNPTKVGSPSFRWNRSHIISILMEKVLAERTAVGFIGVDC